MSARDGVEGSGHESQKRANLVRSVHQRLVNHARANREEAQAVFTRYGQERLLYRLSSSPHREDFVLKGALLFRLWEAELHRPTMDLDLLAYGENAVERLVSTFREVCALPVQDDGLVFPPESVSGQPIREEEAYGGVRLRLLAMLGGARVPLRVDIGFGDAVLPAPEWRAYPTLLGLPEPVIRAYPEEAVVAEKLHVIVVHGLLNSRLKDYYDLWSLARHRAFDGACLARAIAATFRARGTALPVDVPAALSAAFADDPAKQRAWTAFLSRHRLEANGACLPEVVAAIVELAMPPLIGAAQPGFQMVWRAGGPWQSAK